MKAIAKKWVAVFQGDTCEVIVKMQHGIPARTVPRIAANLGLSPDKLFDLLRLPKSTVKSRISSRGKLSATKQDRMYRAEKVVSRAVQVLEDEEAAKVWLIETIDHSTVNCRLPCSTPRLAASSARHIGTD